jgi:hypothetical protein
MSEDVERFADFTGDRLVVPLQYHSGYGDLVVERGEFAPVLRIHMPPPGRILGEEPKPGEQAWVVLTDDLWDRLVAMREYVKNLS